MEGSHSYMIAYTAIIGNYEELKEPLITTPGWKYICFTDQNISSDVWQIKKVERKQSATRTAREIKILFHKYIKEKYSLWIDASFQINCDLNEWWDTRFTPPFTCIQHPIRKSVYEEAKYCMAFNRGNKAEVEKQIARYYKLKVPGNNLIQSGILMRERTKEVIEFCEQWYDELAVSSTRDQISFAYAAAQNKIHNLVEWNYRNSDEFIYYKHFKYRR